MNKIEICCDSYLSVRNAMSAGADRIELCSNLSVGGTTPSYGLLKQCSMMKRDIPINVLIRPRAGDFLYDDAELEEIRQEIILCKNLHFDGIVAGFLNDDGSIDTQTTAEMVQLARPLSFTFHRAFDVSDDPFKNLEDIIATGADRILTSGMKHKAIDGKDLIAELIRRANGRIIIMPGSGINAGNILNIKQLTNASELHFSASSTVNSKMTFRRENIISKPEDDYTFTFSDAKKISEVKKILSEV